MRIATYLSNSPIYLFAYFLPDWQVSYILPICLFAYFLPDWQVSYILPIYLFAYFTYLLKQIVVLIDVYSKRLFSFGDSIFHDDVPPFAFFNNFVYRWERMHDKLHALAAQT